MVVSFHSDRHISDLLRRKELWRSISARLVAQSKFLAAELNARVTSVKLPILFTANSRSSPRVFAGKGQ